MTYSDATGLSITVRVIKTPPLRPMPRRWRAILRAKGWSSAALRYWSGIHDDEGRAFKAEWAQRNLTRRALR